MSPTLETKCPIGHLRVPVPGSRPSPRRIEVSGPRRHLLYSVEDQGGGGWNWRASASGTLRAVHPEWDRLQPVGFDSYALRNRACMLDAFSVKFNALAHLPRDVTSIT